MYQLTDAEREWAEAKVGQRIDVRPWTNGAKNRLKGTVVDYKPDTVGMGVFFVCQLDKPNKQGDMEEESYRAFPVWLNDRVKTARNIKHQLSNESRQIVEERIARQEARFKREQDNDDDFDPILPF